MAENSRTSARTIQADETVRYADSAEPEGEALKNICPGCEEHGDGEGACPVPDSWGAVRDALTDGL